MASNDKKEVRCSFCGRTQDEVKRLIAGPNAYICNECVKICAELIEEEMENAENTERFALDKNALDKIWSEKYLAAHPDAAPESIAARCATSSASIISSMSPSINASSL